MTDTGPEIPAASLCDMVEAQFRGTLFAYTPSMDTLDRYRLSIVREGESGHFPLWDHFAYGTAAEMERIADYLNQERLHLDNGTVIRLVARSLRPRRDQDDAPIEDVTFVVICLDDEGMAPKWTLATRRAFRTREAAETYRAGVAPGRTAIVVSGNWAGLRLP